MVKYFSNFGNYINEMFYTFSLNLKSQIPSLSLYLVHAQRQWTALLGREWWWHFGHVLWQNSQVLAHRELYEGVRETHPRAGNRLTKIGARNLGFLKTQNWNFWAVDCTVWAPLWRTKTWSFVRCFVSTDQCKYSATSLICISHIFMLVWWSWDLE